MSPEPVTTPQLLELLESWLPARRWFHEHQDATRLTVVESFELVDPQGEARLPVLLLGTGPDPRPPYVQVPLSLRPAGSHVPSALHVGTVADGTWEVFDGPGDPAFVRAWLAAADDDGDLQQDTLDITAARLVSGEQSNSSIILPARDGAGNGAILKIFRGLWIGPNPDVDVPAALARAGFDHVPAPLAWLEHRWGGEAALPGTSTPPSSSEASSDVSSSVQLGVLSVFVPGARDGFELACSMAARGESFAPLATELGTVLGGLHEALVAALPGAGYRVDPLALTAHLVARLEWAIREVPVLAEWRAPVSNLLAGLAGLVELPALQRIHGDLHLGQLLRAGDEWFVLDFEGEPLVPLADRAQPDLALRDVAGILRSFDYAAARGGAAEDWTLEARDAFLDAYRAAAPDAATPQAGVVLRAFEVDKALYEVVYETQNRPSWADIPTRALHRLVGTPPEGPVGGRVEP